MASILPHAHALAHYRRGLNYVWNINTLTWDAETQPTAGSGGGGDATAANQATGNASLSSIDTKLSSQATATKQDTGNVSLASLDGKVTAVNTGAVVVSSSALPSGAATGTKQDTGNTSLGSIDTKLTSQATAAKQDTGNTSLSSVDTKLSSQATAAKQDSEAVLVGAVTETAPSTDTASSGLNGRLQRIAQRLTSLIALFPSALSNGFFQVSVKETITLPASQSGTWTVQPGNTANTTAWKVDGSAATQPVSGTFWQTTQPVSGTVTANAGTNLNTSTLALEAGGNLAAIKADVDKIPSQGQALAAASTPVVLTAIQVSALTPPAAITGFALEAGHLAAIDTSTAKIPAQGQALAAASLPVVLTAAQLTTLTPPAAITGFALESTLSGHNALLGAVTEAAPASDTASSGLNGRLQRIAQRLTSLIALVPTSLSNGFFQVSLKETITVPASQSGTWTVQPGNTANTTAWKVDGSAVTQPVSGTFFQATQPVSIASMPSTPVTGTFWQATQPVSGTFFQATQPVSIASMPSTPVTGTFFQATQPVSNAGTFATQPTEARPSAATLTQADWTAISDSTRALTLLAANTARRGLSVRNDTDTKILIREGGTASASAYTDILYPGDEYVSDYPVCTALLSAYIPTIPQGFMSITERA